MVGEKWLSLRPLKRAIQTVRFLLGSSFHKWRRLSSIVLRSPPISRRQVSFHSPPSLTNCTIEDSVANPERTVGRIRRSVSDGWDDIDSRADIFIDNFYRHIQFEREASLKLRQAKKES
ncbi:hypothetical protein ACLOJK_030646 [Asimina triloba]